MIDGQQELFEANVEMEFTEVEHPTGTTEVYERLKSVNGIDTYMQMTRETAQYPGYMNTDVNDENGDVIVDLGALSYVGLGLGEVGEIQGKLKKLIRDGALAEDETGTQILIIPPAKRDEIIKEIGDAFWYLARLCDELDVLPSKILAGNINKLRSRKNRGVIGGSGDNR